MASLPPPGSEYLTSNPIGTELEASRRFVSESTPPSACLWLIIVNPDMYRDTVISETMNPNFVSSA